MATLKIGVEEARGLPVMDTLSNSTDAYVEVKHNTDVKKTPIVRKSLNPKWNCGLKFDIANLEALQEEPVEIRVYDKNALSADSLIGMVLLDLNALLHHSEEPTMVPHWFPIFDTLKGQQGELFLFVRLKFYSEHNPFRPKLPVHVPGHAGALYEAASTGPSLVTDTEGVHIFSTSRLDPSIYRIESVVGMVEELFVKPDPEHATFQSLRSARVINDARILQMYKLSGKVRRQLGKKVIELGCNCVLGYREQFDLEPDNGIIIRAVGTACIISAVDNTTKERHRTDDPSNHSEDGVNNASLILPPNSGTGGAADPIVHKRHLRNVGMTRSQVLILTMKDFPPGVVRRIGGCVSAQSVKVVTQGKNKAIITQQRDHWWAELRDEIRANARALRCNAVIAYEEKAEYHEDVVVLCALGTAVLVDNTFSRMSLSPEEHWASLRKGLKCGLAHSPYSVRNDTDNTSICKVCKRKPVPEFLLSTSEIPSELDVYPETRLIDVRVVRSKEKLKGEALAISISQLLPYIQYMLNKQITYKLQLCKLNAAFGLKMSISIGHENIIGSATATGVYLSALPEPSPLELFSDGGNDVAMNILRTRIAEMQQHNASESESSDTDDNSSTRSEEDETALALTLDDPETLLGISDSAAVADTLCVSVESIPQQHNHFTYQNYIMLQRRYDLSDIPEQDRTLYTTKCCGDIREYLTFKIAQLQCDCMLLAYTLHVRITQYDDLHLAVTGLLVKRDQKKGMELDKAGSMSFGLIAPPTPEELRGAVASTAPFAPPILRPPTPPGPDPSPVESCRS
eukprot:PhF_6_TR31531/c0_g2_i1/m.46485